MAWTTSDRVMALRGRHIAIDVGVDTLDGWRRHISGRNASVVAFFGFLSIFPLMLAATTILGFVLRDNEDLQQKIIEGALEDIPVIGQELANDPTAIDGSIWVLLIGLGGALWSATKAFAMIHIAQDDVWEVDVDVRAPMPVQRGRALLGLLIMGGAQIATLAMTTFVSAVDLPLGGRIPLYVDRVGGEHPRAGRGVPHADVRRADLARRVARRHPGRVRLRDHPAVRHRDRGAHHAQRRRHLRPVRPRAGHRHLAQLPVDLGDHGRRTQRGDRPPPRRLPRRHPTRHP